MPGELDTVICASDLESEHHGIQKTEYFSQCSQCLLCVLCYNLGSVSVTSGTILLCLQLKEADIQGKVLVDGYSLNMANVDSRPIFSLSSAQPDYRV
eukprot:4821615-Amphidinium_carterae.1